MADKRVQAEKTKNIHKLIDEQEKVVRLESELKESANKAQNLEHEKTHLKQQLGDLLRNQASEKDSKENKQLLIDLRTLEQRIEDASEQVKNLTEELDEKEAKFDKIRTGLEDQIKQQYKTIETLYETVEADKKLREENQKLKDHLNDLISTHFHTNTKLSVLENENEKLGNENTFFISTIRKGEQKLKVIEEENQTLISGKATKDQEVLGLKQQITTLNTQLAKKRDKVRTLKMTNQQAGPSGQQTPPQQQQQQQQAVGQLTAQDITGPLVKQLGELFSKEDKKSIPFFKGT